MEAANDFVSKFEKLLLVCRDIREARLAFQGGSSDSGTSQARKDSCLSLLNAYDKAFHEMNNKGRNAEFLKHSIYERNKDEILKGPHHDEWLRKNPRPYIQFGYTGKPGKKLNEKIRVQLGDIYEDAITVARLAQEQLTKKGADEKQWKEDDRIIYPQLLMMWLYRCFSEFSVDLSDRAKLTTFSNEAKEEANRTGEEKAKENAPAAGQTYQLGSALSGIASMLSEKAGGSSANTSELKALSDQKILQTAATAIQSPAVANLLTNVVSQLSSNDKLKNLSKTGDLSSPEVGQNIGTIFTELMGAMKGVDLQTALGGVASQLDTTKK